jgi:hypothetical protein
VVSRDLEVVPHGLDVIDYLGDLTDEVPDNRIIEFVTGGPKNYAYQIAKPDKNGNTSICKVRGITLFPLAWPIGIHD